MRLSGLIPSVQTQRLHGIAQSSDELIRSIVKKVTAGSDKNKIPSIWDLRVVRVKSEELGDEEPALEQELLASQIIFPKTCDWRKQDFTNWTKLPS